MKKTQCDQRRIGLDHDEQGAPSTDTGLHLTDPAADEDLETVAHVTRSGQTATVLIPYREMQDEVRNRGETHACKPFLKLGTNAAQRHQARRPDDWLSDI